MDFFSTQNILVHIPIGAGGYDLSWIEAVGTIAGLLCIWLASLEKISNYAFGLVNVTLFARGINIHLQTRLYFDDEAEANGKCPILNLIEQPARRETLIAQRCEVDGKLAYRFDIRIQGEGETVFFDF